MTTPIEALELKPCPFCGGQAIKDTSGEFRHHGINYPVHRIRCDKSDCLAMPSVKNPIEGACIDTWNTRATASLEGDAVERVALRRTVLDILNSVAPAVENLACNQEQADADGCMVKVSRQAVDEVLAAVNEVAIQAATATGLVAGEAAIRGDWHTTGWDRARNSGRILLVWREFAGVREHVELGRYSDSKTAWVNTYGHPFHAEPDGWAPLLPFKTAETIRADEREKCAKIIEPKRPRPCDCEWCDCHNQGDAEAVAVWDADTAAAAAIRSGGGE